MRRTRIKVCGLRRRADVEACLAQEVDMLGFNCWPGSPRFASPSSIREALAGGITPEVVLVFVNAAPENVRQVIDEVGIPRERLCVQLHGDEELARYVDLGVPVLQVLRVDASHGAAPSPVSKRVLVDALTPVFGGSGTRVDQDALEQLLPGLPAEWLLAGGLRADNVGAAIARFGPWGVDVASGVERAPGVKDHEALTAFVAAVRATEHTTSVRRIRA